MSIKKMTEKFKDVLSEKDLLEVQSGIKKMISEEVSIRVESEKNRLADLAEEYCDMKIKKVVSAIKAKLNEQHEKEMNKLEENVVDKLDKFLDLEISSKLDDNLLKSIAVNETLQPLVNGIKALFEDKYVALDSEGEGLLRKSNAKIKKLEEKVADLINDKIDLTETAEKGAIKLLISEKTKDLTKMERSQVTRMCEGKDFNELYKKINTYVDIVVEKTAIKSKTINSTDSFSDEECLAESVIDVRKKDSDGSENYWKAISNLI